MGKVVAIIQARMGSTRLPGKVMMRMAGKPMLQRVIERVQAAKLVDEIIVACPRDESYMRINALTLPMGIQCVAPDVDDNDVLGRFARVAAMRDAGILVRICGDSPLMEPTLIDDAVRRLEEGLSHYTHWQRTDGTPLIETKEGIFPEAFTSRALRYANQTILLDDATGREHVTIRMRERRTYNPHMTVTTAYGINRAVDTQEDFDRVEQMIIEEEATNANNRTSEREAIGAG
jgi:spore coat polysaccharide biosynthesis protein SpsF (cytidylyltransferase family)